jgi:hypothetical protein
VPQVRVLPGAPWFGAAAKAALLTMAFATLRNDSSVAKTEARHCPSRHKNKKIIKYHFLLYKGRFFLYIISK